MQAGQAGGQSHQPHTCRFRPHEISFTELESWTPGGGGVGAGAGARAKGQAAKAVVTRPRTKEPSHLIPEVLH